MKKINFLKRLKKEGKLKLVEPSKEISLSYLRKSNDCFKSAKILLQNKLYENSIIESYYCMYNSLLALLFMIGIKSENHSASIILLEKLFDEKIANIISLAKKERIDKQYYIESFQNLKLIEESSHDLILKTEDFSIKIRTIINEINNEKISSIRKRFEEMIKEF